MMAMQKVDPRKADSTDVEVGRLIRALRMSRNLSQTELGNQIGVTFQQVQKYETGGNRVSMGRLTLANRVNHGEAVWSAPPEVDSFKRRF